MAYQSRLYGVIDVRSGECVLTGGNREVSEFTGIALHKVAVYTREKHIYQGRYRIIVKDPRRRVFEPDDTETNKIDSDLKRRWDDMRTAAEMIRTGRGVIRMIKGKRVTVAIGG